MYVYAHGHEFESQMTLGIVPQLLSACLVLFLRQGLSLDLELSRQVGQLVPGIGLSLPHQYWDYEHMLPCLTFLHTFWGTSSHTCTCTASASPSEPSLQPSTLVILTRSSERTQVPCQLPPNEFRMDL